MKPLLFSTLLIIAVTVNTFAQSITRSTINCMGNSVRLENMLIRQTIGQAAIVGNVLNEAGLRQGFQQPVSPKIGQRHSPQVQIEVFPNPASSEFTLSLNGDIGQYEYSLRDIHGKELIVGEAFENKHRLSCDQLSSGIYLLTVLQKTQILGVQRIVINK